MPNSEILLTKEGLKKLEEELEFLRLTKRKEVSERIKEALAFGDISENSEYDEAKNEQAVVEKKIAEIEYKIANAQIIKDNRKEHEKVMLGCKVLVKDVEYNEDMEYKIVGSSEADPFEQKISNVSPLGEALIGKKVGETVEVRVPAGATIMYKILRVN